MQVLAGVATFFHSLVKVADIRIDALCTETHVSSRTYYKIKRHEPVKPECYWKLFIGLCRAVTDEEFLEHWAILGKCLHEACDDTDG